MIYWIVNTPTVHWYIVIQVNEVHTDWQYVVFLSNLYNCMDFLGTVTIVLFNNWYTVTIVLLNNWGSYQSPPPYLWFRGSRDCTPSMFQISIVRLIARPARVVVYELCPEVLSPLRPPAWSLQIIVKSQRHIHSSAMQNIFRIKVYYCLGLLPIMLLDLNKLNPSLDWHSSIE